MSVITLSRLKKVLFLMVVILMGFRLAGASSPTGDDWKRDLGREDHIAYIVLDELRPNRDVDPAPALTLNDAKLGLPTFYREFRWSLDTCWAGSILKEGVRAYCLPYARLGQYYPSARDPSVKVFSCIGSCPGLYLWHVPHQNSFYVWASCWNVSGVLGPFLGDPRISLPLAVKPRKGQRSFPGVTLTLVSQRWLFTDARGARVPRDEHYDCAHGHMSGRAVEMLRLNTFITRFRLTNRGTTDIYYQTESGGSDKPAACGLSNPLHTNWDHVLKTDYFCDIAGDTWGKLARGAVIDFERTDQGFAQVATGFVLLLNEKPNYWDASKLLGTYPVMYGRN
jgi:hypothetical protein